MEWNRKKYKENAKRAIKKNYWFLVAVCFIISFMGIEHSSSTNLIHKYNSENETEKVVEDSGKITNWDIWAGTVDEEGSLTKNTNENLSAWDNIKKDLFNLITEAETFIFKLLQAWKNFLSSHELLVFIFLAIAAMGEIFYRIMIQNTILIGQKRFLLENRVREKTEISKLFYTWRRGSFWNSVKVMFLRNVFQWLWALTIIGGFIKLYEYRMIPFILAENPTLSHKEVFALSKEMMRGHKWSFFVMDLSFLGWILLESFTCGLTGIFYSYPYQAAADAEVYIAVRQDVIENKKSYYEGLNESLFSEY